MLVGGCCAGLVVPLLVTVPFQQFVSSWGHLSSHILEAPALQQLLLEQEMVSGNMWLWCKKPSGEAAVAGYIWLIVLMSKKWIVHFQKALLLYFSSLSLHN